MVLSHLGKALPEQRGPYVVVTILRMFNSAPIQDIFRAFEFRFEKLQGIRLRQRQFEDDTEQDKTIKILHEHKIDSSGLEDEGNLYADLFIAAPDADFKALEDAIKNKHAELLDDK